MRLQEIKRLAEALLREIEPFCRRIEIAGSIRREKPECKDIEIVCIPDKSGVPLQKYFNSKAEQIFKKNGQKYKQFLWDGIWVDLFITDEEHWGLIYLIRTGSKEFNIKTIGKLKKSHHYIRDGKFYGPNKITRLLEEIYIREEQTLFDILGTPFIKPIDRN